MARNFNIYSSSYDGLANQQAGNQVYYSNAEASNRAAMIQAREFELQQQAQADQQDAILRERDIQRQIEAGRYSDQTDFANRQLDSQDYLRRAQAKMEGLRFAPSSVDYENLLKEIKFLPNKANVGSLYPNLTPAQRGRAEAMLSQVGSERDLVNQEFTERKAINERNNQNVTMGNALQVAQSLPINTTPKALSDYLSIPESQAVTVLDHVAKIRAVQAEQAAREATQRVQTEMLRADVGSTSQGTNAPSFKMRERFFDAYDPRVPGVVRNENAFTYLAPQTNTATNNPYVVNSVYSGMKYLGGDPNMEQSWQRIR